MVDRRRDERGMPPHIERRVMERYAANDSHRARPSAGLARRLPRVDGQRGRLADAESRPDHGRIRCDGQRRPDDDDVAAGHDDINNNIIIIDGYG
jgi:hypothetical protein